MADVTSPLAGQDFVVVPSFGLRVDRNIIGSFTMSPTVGIVAKDLGRMASSLESFQEPLTRAVVTVVIPSIRHNFDAEGRPAWEPLAPDTVLRRKASGPILKRTGTLKSAATSLGIWDIGRQSATVRKLPQGAWYGYVHQAGYKGGGTGGFGKHIAAAQRELGPRAGGMEVIRLAYAIMDVETGGPKGQRSAGIDIPQRQFVMIQDEDIEKIQEIFFRWMVEKTIVPGGFGGSSASAAIGGLL